MTQKIFCLTRACLRGHSSSEAWIGNIRQSGTKSHETEMMFWITDHLQKLSRYFLDAKPTGSQYYNLHLLQSVQLVDCYIGHIVLKANNILRFGEQSSNPIVFSLEMVPCILWSSPRYSSIGRKSKTILKIKRCTGQHWQKSIMMKLIKRNNDDNSHNDSGTSLCNLMDPNSSASLSATSGRLISSQNHLGSNSS